MACTACFMLLSILLKRNQFRNALEIKSHKLLMYLNQLRLLKKGQGTSGTDDTDSESNHKFSSRNPDKGS